MNKEQKADWTKRALDHQQADRFIQGSWLDDEKSGDFYRGCMFGCMTQSDKNTISKASEEMDVPEWLNRLAERIFEGLAEDEAVLFPAQFVEAMPVDLSKNQYDEIWHKTSAARLRRTLEYIKDVDDQWGVNDAVNSIIDLHESDWDETAAWSAESAAWSARSAARSAESAARSAARSAESAAESAESAEWSAESAAESAESAEWSAWSAESAAESAESAERSAWSARSARSAEYQSERDFLLKTFTEMQGEF